MSDDFSFEKVEKKSCPLAGQEVRLVLQTTWGQRHPRLKAVFTLFLLLLCVGIGMLIASPSHQDQEDCLALVQIKGPIMSTEKELEWIEQLKGKDYVKGILLRVDSPGGGAASSQELYEALASLAAKKPIVVSMGSSAASGGLMVSMAGERIFALGSTVTGSIGVRMDLPQLKELAEKIGIGLETLTTAPFKDAGSTLRPLSPQERASFERVLRDMHEQFVSIIMKGRKMSREQVLSFATGEIYTGLQAKALGLVDEIGGMAEAKAWLAKKTNVPESKELLKMPKKRSWLQRQIESSLRAALSTFMESKETLFLYQ